MRTITIYRRFFTSADCYKNGAKNAQTPKGVQVHSTGANNPNLKRYVQPDDGRIGKNVNSNSHNRPGLTVCASAYIGKQSDGTVAIYQALPWNYRCWLSGSGKGGNANRMGYVGYEICEDSKQNESYFREAVMGAAVNLTAFLCQSYGIGVDMVRDHRELHGMGLASNHGDILHWLRLYGLTMDDFRAEVEKALQEGVQAVYVNCGEEPAPDPGQSKPTLRRGCIGDAVKELQVALLALGADLGGFGEHGDGIDGRFGAATEKAVRAFQAAHGLTVDGVVGSKTWAALEKEKKPPDEKQEAPRLYTVVIPDVDAATATYLLESYPGAYAEDLE